MAESIREEILTNCLTNGENITNVECAVCLQTCVHPAELPCGHIFCYLCIKGIVNQGRRCAMCRQDIPVDYLDKPRLLKPMEAECTSRGFEDGHLWFYEGHNGWWQYDERTSIELECAYQKGERCCDLLIAGFLYVADFDGMLQYRKSDPSRRRRIKRDLATTSKKGIAGLKATKNSNLTSLNSLEILSNETTQNLPVPSSSTLNSLNDLRIFASCSYNSNQHSEPIQNFQNSSGCSLSTGTTSNPADMLEDSSADNSTSFTINSNLDSVIYDTLDWTIEQIDSLNFELLNDYETLFRDVNNYRQRGDNINQSRFRRVSNNYISRYLNEGNTSSESLYGVLDPINRGPDLPHPSNNLNNSSSEDPLVTSQETITSYSENNETQLETSLPEPGSPPHPPRNRGINRARERRDSSQDSSSLNCESLFQRFISNK